MADEHRALRRSFTSRNAVLAAFPYASGVTWPVSATSRSQRKTRKRWITPGRMRGKYKLIAYFEWASA